MYRMVMHLIIKLVFESRARRRSPLQLSLLKTVCEKTNNPTSFPFKKTTFAKENHAAGSHTAGPGGPRIAWFTELGDGATRKSDRGFFVWNIDDQDFVNKG
jgi:hypothetical protein